VATVLDAAVLAPSKEALDFDGFQGSAAGAYAKDYCLL